MENQEIVVEADLSKHSYAIAVPCYEGKIVAETALSLCSLSHNLTARKVKHAFLIVRAGALIDAVRNELFDRFLHETPECDTIILIDADIEFSWEDAERLLVFSDMYPVVSGTYSGRIDPPKFVVNVMDNKLNEHGLLPHGGTGLGFTAVTRAALESLKVEEYHTLEKPEKKIKEFCRTGRNSETGLYVGEDVFFFKKCLEAGIQPYIDPGISLKHHGTKVYDFPFKNAIHQILGEKKWASNAVK